VRKLIERAATGETFTERDRVTVRRDRAFVTRLCVQAVNRLFEAGGARAVVEPDPLQRYHRDAHAASHHAALAWDAAAEAYGRLLSS
jgi:3-hydroxy-9,10-secoandrosta-1,3,5(10)-triene-9,17-dione monooxygenase